MPLSQEAITLLLKFLEKDYMIAIMTGGRTFPQLKEWLIEKLPKKVSKTNNILLCTEYGNQIYQKNIYWEIILESKPFNKEYTREITKIWKGIDPQKYGLESITEDQFVEKKTVFSIACIGNNTDREKKKLWDIEMERRKKLVEIFEKRLSFDINMYIAGRCTIDFVEIGNDKASNISRISNFFNIDYKDIEYFGDEFTEYGNDYPILSLPIEVHIVDNHYGTLEILERKSHYF